MVVRLVTTANDEATRKARAALERLPNATIEVSYCPPAVAEWYECPFVRDERGHEYFGVDGIEFFVAQHLDHLVS
jgi:hypothetical protein